ncbi:hypothetical protein EDB84DRAFT_1564687 [Lactarius hengduanensis]|nr:hypothetical protein EDB84DRAFT_1564687 [Lactarius hengduanensis]
MPVATVPPDTSYPQPDPDEPHILFNDPDADVVLLSGDSQTFRVLKLYIIRSSTVLGKLIQAASNTSKSGAANSASARTRLPEVQLSDSSAILSCLLTFIFPVPSVLPSSLDEKMELLSVAQKYEMSSVMDHIRGSLSQQDPPFIHRENAFLAYSLAQKYGLRREAIQAARFTLKFTLTIEKFEDVMPGAYLHELWKYHQRVQAWLKFDLPLCGVGAMLNAFKCSSHQYATGPPDWVRSYIMSIANNPSLFDPIEFQMALMRHTTGTVSNVVGTSVAGCIFCAQIPVETMRTFWTTLTAVVHLTVEKAESELSILGIDTSPQSHEGLPAASFPLPECLDISEADVIVRSSDGADFLVHKAILASSSPVFRDMFSLPRSPNSEAVGELATVEISEDAELVRSLITILYPIPSEIPASYDKILALLAAAHKYDMTAVQSSIRGEVAHRQSPVLDGAQAFRAYAIASSSRLIPEMNTAASLTLDYPMTFEHLGDDLRLFEGWALHELSNFRKGCRDKLVSCFESFLNTLNGPSRIWIDCRGNKAQPLNEGGPALPTWVRDFFSQQIEELKQDFTRPLVKPSIVRSKYLRALLEHATRGYPGKCTFCLEKHATNGEDYSVQLEREIARAREKASVVFLGYPWYLNTRCTSPNLQPSFDLT